MSSRSNIPLACSAMLVLLLAGAGCTTTSIGDVAYRNNTLIVSINNSGAPVDAFVQVTVYEIRDFNQQKLTVLQAPATIRQGPNEVLVPAELPPGSYKLYVYILKPGERETATIRDIVV
jgi:hypothetical protein